MKTLISKMCWLAAVAAVGMSGCVNKPAVKPKKLYANVGPTPVGGPMRVEADTPLARTPPKLPIIVKDAVVDADNGKQPAPPPPPTMKSSAIPTVISSSSSPVPNSVDAAFVPAQTTVLGGLFDSLFIPPTPQPPTTSSSARYQEVK